LWAPGIGFQATSWKPLPSTAPKQILQVEERDTVRLLKSVKIWSDETLDLTPQNLMPHLPIA